MNVIAQAQFKTGIRHYDMSEAERKTRVEAAAAFRLAHHYRWNLQINNHICVRIPGKPDHFLMNPYGLGWDEITASNLATVRMDGEIVSHEGVTLGPAGLELPLRHPRRPSRTSTAPCTSMPVPAWRSRRPSRA